MFAALAQVDGSGCAFPQPLEAMRRSLVHAQHRAFLRSEAYLLVVVIAAHDDCSLATTALLDGVLLDPIDTSRCYTRTEGLVPLDVYAEALRAAKPGTDVHVSMVRAEGPTVLATAGDRVAVSPACTVDDAASLPSPRLRDFTSAFPNRATTTSICQRDLSGALAFTPGFGTPPPGNPCVEATLADVDPDREGRQLDCQVWYRFADTARADEAIPPCAAERRAPCWEIRSDSAQCPNGPMELLHVEHAANLPRGTRVRAECVTQ